MKLTTFLMMISLMYVHAKGYGQINLNERHTTLDKVLRLIEKQTDYVFLVKNYDVSNLNISIQVKNKTINETLSKCFEDLPLTFKIIGKNIAIIEREKEVPNLLNSRASAFITISGKVVDIKGKPVPGVNVMVKGIAGKGSTTDGEGKFSIVARQGDILVFSFIGFKKKEVEVGNNTVVDVTLEEEPEQLDAVVVVGYGSVKKTDLTGSVSSIGADKVTQVKAISNVAQSLQGQMAGVRVNQGSGQPGEGMLISIRGTNSIGGGNAPLYVIDGILSQGISAQVNVDDIASIDVLKDASSTAIYGSRGANGVIIITTKSGKIGGNGKVKVDYNGYYGFQNLRKRKDLIDASEFAQLQNEVAANDGEPLPYTAEQVKAFGKGTDWQALVYKTAPVQNHTLSFSGGSENTKYYTSLGYFDQDGIIENSNYRRLSSRLNLEHKLNEKLRFVANLSVVQDRYLRANYQGADFGGVPFQTMVMPATQGVYDANGKYTVFTGVSWGQTNPVGVAKEQYNPSNTLRILGNAAFTYEIIKGLNFKTSASVDANSNKADVYNPPSITFGQPAGNASKTYGNTSSFVNENTLNYNHTFGDHHFDALAGITYQFDKSEGLYSGLARGFVTNDYQNNNIQAATVKGQPETSYGDRNLISYLGRLNYNYKGKYFATFTSRYDGSSVFGENNKFGFFPSGALAWKISEEDFLKNNATVSDLKIRASYGASGNQAIEPYQTLARVGSVNPIFDNKPILGYVLGTLPNKDLKWETTTEFDLGFDLGLLNNRIQFTADYYRKETKDLLLNVTLPPSSGFSSVLQNVGSVQNRGFEFQLSSKNIEGEDFKWSSVLTFSHNKNKVVDLGKAANGNPISYKEVGAGGNWFPMIIGRPMFSFYGQTVTGVYQNDEEAIANGEVQKRAGEYRFLDYNQDGVVDDSDKHVLANLTPKFTFGFNNTFSYKNFDLSLLFVGSFGNDIVNEFRKYNLALNGLWTTSQEAFNERWKGPGTSNTGDKPSKNSMQYTRDYANSLWVENGSYLKLRDITLGYTFAPKLLKSLKISSVYVFASAQNYFTLTNYSGYDPEVSWSSSSVNGWDRGNYPSTKSITTGVKVNF
ncbi:TonB-dependent receptor [Pedobacter nyackensis]|uniref:SusC/RagA family TonB-linked outer membrane protein n=1 Tax=Pedobacter nyackensis TaxID=475255 RepID=UPI00292F622D|nr:TonB-dependent receptor [Pedobacter nyackensis]